VTGALEMERAEKRLRSGLDAAPVVWVTADRKAQLADVDLAEIAIASEVAIREGAGPDGAFRLADVPGVAVEPKPTDAEKCDRCWRRLPDVGSVAAHPALCGRCADVVERLPANSEAAE